MATKKSNDKKTEAKSEILWRKPITLDDDEADDPLASLYQGRESSTQIDIISKETRKNENLKPKVFEVTRKKYQEILPENNKKKTEKIKDEPIEKIPVEKIEEKEVGEKFKISESELKKSLKIKSENFQFTDIREILRGKSLEMYAYLRFLAGETGGCKIKHLDLMKRLDISRPTLFKQGEWLTTLSLIKKRNVPGDHFGTSYTVYRLEEVLPVSETLKKQFESQFINLIENFK